MGVTVDNRQIRHSTTQEQEKYLRGLLNNVTAERVANELIASVASGSLPPSVLRVWLDIDRTPAALVAALRQQHSAFVRKTALEHLGRCFRRAGFEPTWTALGGTEECLHLLADMPVTEVRLFCRAVKSTKNAYQDRHVREPAITQLMQALFHRHFTNSRFQSPDSRPLEDLYIRMLPACTAEMCLAWIENSTLPQAPLKDIMATHPDIFRKSIITKFKEKMDVASIQRYGPLFQRLPEQPASTDRVSESMKFSLQILESADQYNCETSAAPDFVRILIIPLMRRLVRRRVSGEIAAHALDSINRYIETQSSAKEWLKSDRNSEFARAYVQLWYRHSAVVEPAFIEIIRTVPGAFEIDLAQVGPLSRYRLLTLLLKHRPHYRTDIAGDESWSDKVPWEVDWFLQIPPNQAASLLTKLSERSLQQPKITYRRRNSILSFLPPGAQEQHADWKMLRLYLGRGDPAILREAQELVQLRKKSAEHSRDQQTRAQFAKWAILTSIASGSLDLYAETLLWARRYNKDALTIKVIYAHETLHSTESLDLLCGLKPRSLTIDAVRTEISKANGILLQLLETACKALREPSFDLGTWRNTYNLWPAALTERLLRSDEVQAHLHCSDEDWFDIVWQPTSDAILAAERISLRPEFKGLHFTYSHANVSAKRSPKAVLCRFVDELAKSRDDLWRQHRRSTHPTVTTLPEPYPKSLPVQNLYHYSLPDVLKDANLPFIRERAMKVVFTPGAIALRTPPEDEETLEAIGRHVDRWISALKFYVEHPESGTTRDDRVARAWNHALTELSAGQLSADEAVAYWRQVFYEAKLNPPTVKLSEEQPPSALPCSDGIDQPIEWNPDPNATSQRRKRRELPSTCLDDMLYGIRGCKRETIESYHTFWGPFGSQRLPTPADRDALMTAGLLCLQAKAAGTGPLFRRPLPDAHDVRFPVVFLDQDFLDRMEHDNRLVISTLQALVESVPSKVLLDACNLAAAPLLGSKEVSPEQLSTTMELIKLLSCSDNPHFAVELISKIICSRPEDSSWHRYLLNSGFLKRLRASQVKEFLLQLVDDICGILKKQAARPSTEQSKSNEPLVKVSTVKMLAQLSRSTVAVRPEDAMEILGRILVDAKHLDVRKAAVESLVDTIAHTDDAQIEDSAFCHLRTTAVPIAAALTELHPMTNEEWAAVMRENTVPDVGMALANSALGESMQEILLKATTRHGLSAPKTSRLVKECLLPMVSASATNNTRWTDLFLRAHGFTLHSSLPEVPADPSILPKIFGRYHADCPAHVFLLHYEYIKTNMIRRDDLKSIVDRIYSSPKLRDSNAGKHFLSLWGWEFNAQAKKPGMAGPINTAASVYMMRLTSGSWSAENSTDLRPETVVDALKDLLMTQIYKTDDLNFFESYDSFLKSFQAPRRPQAETAEKWTKYCRPVVEELIGTFDDLRTEEWQMASDRRPALIPDTFPMRLWLLTYPTWQGGDDIDTRRQVFAEEIRSLIDEIALLSPYHQRLQQLKTALESEGQDEWSHLALRLGELDDKASKHPTLAMHLRIDVVDKLLHKAMVRPFPAGVLARVRTMLDQWRRSTTEAFRVRAIHTLAALDRQEAVWEMRSKNLR